jgi:hypothetical protein
MKLSQDKFTYRYGDRGPWTFILTRCWTLPSERSICILEPSWDGEVPLRRSRVTVTGAAYPEHYDAEFTRDDQMPGGTPISYSYCAPLNRSELQRLNEAANDLKKKAQEDDVLDSAPHKATMSFYRAVRNRFYHWYHIHNIPPPNLETVDLGEPTSSERRKFVNDIEHRRRAVVRAVLPTKEAIEDFDFDGGLTELSEALLHMVKELSEEQDVFDEVDSPMASSMQRYVAEKTPDHLTRTQRLVAIYYWGHKMTEELDEMEPHFG